MKKERKTLQFLIIPLACAQTLTWQGCTQEDTPMATPPAMPHTTYELHLHDTAATRVSVDENSYRFRWDAGDQITVWMGSDFDTTQPYAFSTADGGMGMAHIAVYIGNGQAVHGGYNGNQTVVSTVNVGSGPVYIHLN